MKNKLFRFLMFSAVGAVVLVGLLAAVFFFALPPVSNASIPDDPVKYPAFANERPFSIYVMSERESPCHVMAVYDLARKHFGDGVLTWGVQEIDGVNYVIAFNTWGLGVRYDPRERQIMELMANYEEPATCAFSKEEVAQLFPVVNR